LELLELEVDKEVLMLELKNTGTAKPVLALAPM
jgi:hypothetical protein